MKKFFTLVIAACAAFSASAKQNLDLFSPWGGTCILEGTTYTFDGSWAGAGLWLGTEIDGVNTWCDASAYDYAYIAYSNHTGGDISFGVCYNHWEKTESWGDVYTTVSKKADMPEGIVAIKLDKTSASDGGKTYAEEIRQLQLQDAGTAGSITIDEVAFITEEEYQAILAGQGTTVKTKEFGLPGDAGVIEMTEGENAAGWYASSWLGLENIADEGYTCFVLEVASAAAPFQVLAQNWPDGVQRVQKFEATTEPITVVYYIGEGEDQLAGLGQFAFQNMNITDTWMDPATGDEVSWYDANTVVVTRAYLTSEDVLNKPTVQYIVNDDVEAGQKMIGWGGSMTIAIEEEAGNHYYAINNPTKADNNWSVQVAYDTEYTYEVGAVYTLEYDIKGTVAGSTFSAGLQNTNGYKGCGDFGNVAVTTEWQHVTQTCRCSGEGAQRLVISVGDYAGTLYVDNFQVSTPASDIEIVTNDFVRPSSNVTYNIYGQRTNATSGLMIRGGKLILVK